MFDSEESLRKSERLTTLGTLAAEIAHEIRNPLMVIRLLFDSLDLDQGDDDAKNKDLSVIREKLDHLEQIAGRILDFGKSREAFRKDFCITGNNRGCSFTCPFKVGAKPSYLHIKDFRKTFLFMWIRDRYSKRLLNLMLNALVAMPNGGQLTLEAGRSADGKAQILVK